MPVRAALGAMSLLLMICGTASAEPMRLADPTPRWIVVQFEDSPSERPELLDRVYTRPFAAWLEPDAAGNITVRLDSDVLEQTLFLENDPVPGSFSDYVWVFDRTSGDVLSASFTGAFAYVFDWGLARTEVHAQVSARMGTTTAAGFEPLKRVWGRSLYPYCDDVHASGCTAVPPRAYDERGYVNAVGYLAIDSPLTQFATYSAVGEARFSEISSDVPGTPPVAAAAADTSRAMTPISQLSPGPGLAGVGPAGPAH
jgi:hypothetical protein